MEWKRPTLSRYINPKPIQKAFRKSLVALALRPQIASTLRSLCPRQRGCVLCLTILHGHLFHIYMGIHELQLASIDCHLPPKNLKVFPFFLLIIEGIRRGQNISGCRNAERSEISRGFIVSGSHGDVYGLVNRSPWQALSFVDIVVDPIPCRGYVWDLAG